MITHVSENERFCKDRGWLQTCWLFSFDEYYDPANMGIGALRVFNDDVFAAGSGFPLHHHSEMEIITIPLSGAVTHTDSIGNATTVAAGDVQVMSAGTGVRHSEYNRGPDPVHLYQIWIQPDSPGLSPSYDQRHYEESLWRDRLFPLASGRGETDATVMHSDSTVYRAGLTREARLEYGVLAGRCAFIYVTSGELQLNDILLQGHDQARIVGAELLNLAAELDTDLILVDVPAD